jgi:hypothetical protein|tara:strand:+ start:164 stop:358 length:195 start_codon:yes stop_codon:yes gene_type:complete
MGYIDSHTGHYIPNPYLNPHRHRRGRYHRDKDSGDFSGISFNQFLLILIGLLVFFGTIFAISNK